MVALATRKLLAYQQYLKRYIGINRSGVLKFVAADVKSNPTVDSN